MSRFVDEVYTAGLRSPHYVNGRLLSAEDLRAEQEATLARSRVLGRAAGHGIIDGLWVERIDDTRVNVSGGVGVNRDGDVMKLGPNGAVLSMAIEVADGPVREDAGRFQSCESDIQTGDTPLAEGAYVLCARPVAQLEGSVAVVRAGYTAPCADKWVVEGVEFRTTRLDAFGLRGNEALEKTRSRLAHACFGTPARESMTDDPFGFSAQIGLLSMLSEGSLETCDLPLAVFYWGDGGVRFVENWPVRRRIQHVQPGGDWQMFIGDERKAADEARLLQFQAQLARIIAASNKPESIRAATYFNHLPPSGFLPALPPDGALLNAVSSVTSELVNTLMMTWNQQVGGVAGSFTSAIFGQITGIMQAQLQAEATALMADDQLNLEVFFGLATPNIYYEVNHAVMEATFRQHLYDHAIDLRDTERAPLAARKPVSLYFVRESLQDYVRGVAYWMMQGNRFNVPPLGNIGGSNFAGMNFAGFVPNLSVQQLWLIGARNRFQPSMNDSALRVVDDLYAGTVGPLVAMFTRSDPDPLVRDWQFREQG